MGLVEAMYSWKLIFSSFDVATFSLRVLGVGVRFSLRTLWRKFLKLIMGFSFSDRLRAGC